MKRIHIMNRNANSALRFMETLRTLVGFLLLAALFQWLCPVAVAQPVAVTMKLDQPQIAVGAATTLHVFAEVVPTVQARADRIFSWYVDVLNLNGAIAAANYAALQRPASDKDPRTSSTGVTDGSDRLGIFDTFLNLPGAGRSAPVELFSVPVKGLAPGQATIRIRAGSNLPQFGTDFLVAASDGGDPLAGGDYTTAIVTLEVASATGGGTACTPVIGIERLATPNEPNRLTISFPLCAGSNHFIESTDALGSEWQPLPGAPHNSGTVIERVSGTARFYRLRISD